MLHPKKLSIKFFVKVLLVVGGFHGNGNLLSSTEIQKSREAAWEVMSPYPFSVAGLAGVTLENTVYMTGRYSHLKIIISISREPHDYFCRRLYRKRRCRR